MYTIIAANEAVKKVIGTNVGEEDSYCLQFTTRSVRRLYPGGKSSCSGKREAEQGVTAPVFLGSELDKCVSQFEFIRMIQPTKRENFPAKITV